MIATSKSPVIFILGSPCKIEKNNEEIYGRYVGDSLLSSDGDRIILFSTPSGSIIHVKQSSVFFDITEEDLNILIDFEELAMSNNEWYHKNSNSEELESIGTFMASSDIIPLTIEI